MKPRRELSDAAWEFVQPLPPRPVLGRRRPDDRMVLNGIVWKFRTGVAWRDVPERYGGGAHRSAGPVPRTSVSPPAWFTVLSHEPLCSFLFYITLSMHLNTQKRAPLNMFEPWVTAGRVEEQT
ncbi:transposase [Streptomyces inhibens]|uniref:transposase n=1 Tax=Streptomyces inhibens TaxID=2293571 RepID=UPI00402AAAF4